MDPRNNHYRNDLFSLLLHEEAARMIAADDSLLNNAKERLLRWKRLHGSTSPTAWDEWLRLIESGRDTVLTTIVDHGENATRLRQSSPFSPLVPARKRWALLKESRQ